MADDVIISKSFEKKAVDPEPQKSKPTGFDFEQFQKDAMPFLVVVLVHGAFLNYVASVMIGSLLQWWTIPAYGLAWWYIKEELPRIFLLYFWRAKL